MNPDSGRLIRLRRPPVFNPVPDRWIPESVDLDRVDDAWESLRAENPRYHDGDVLHVLGVVRNGHGGATVHLAPSSYRFLAVRARGIDTGIRPLGVKGLCLLRGDSMSSDRFLAGLRSERSGSYPGCWEFLPGGGVPPEDDGEVRPDLVFVRELREECGLEAIDEPVPMAILRDDAVGTWEVVYRATIDRVPASAPDWEHDRV
ncbi:MAG: NUDIX hydrolase, partial [Planctomycetota bacterium]